MDKTTMKALKETIAHWERMIAWARARTNYYITSIPPLCEFEMFEAIKESWYSDSCPLCALFYYVQNDVCSEKCPIFQAYGECGEEEATDNLWLNVEDSESWYEWVINAKKFLEQIKDLQIVAKGDKGE